MTDGISPSRASVVAKTRVGRRNADVAGGGKPHAAAERRPVHPRQRRLGQFGERSQHAGQRARIRQIGFEIGFAGRLHPMRDRRRREKLWPAARQHDGADRVIARQASRKAAISSAIIPSSNALCRSGGSATAWRRRAPFDFDENRAHALASSHPEQAELGRGDRSVQSRRKRQRRARAGVWAGSMMPSSQSRAVA